MTDETYDRLQDFLASEYLRRKAHPTIPFGVDAPPANIVVVPGREPDDVLMVPAEGITAATVYVGREDFADLRRRLPEHQLTRILFPA